MSLWMVGSMKVVVLFELVCEDIIRLCLLRMVGMDCCWIVVVVL